MNQHDQYFSAQNHQVKWRNNILDAHIILIICILQLLQSLSRLICSHRSEYKRSLVNCESQHKCWPMTMKKWVTEKKHIDTILENPGTK